MTVPGSGYDTIIVGAGPAGSVLATRLTENPAHSVLLVEAGPDFGSDATGWPVELLQVLGPETAGYSWGYEHQPRSGAAGRSLPLPLPRARVVGGCSSINSCIWLRGSRADYDRWAELGNPGWSYDELLPYFRRAESDPIGSSKVHGRTGPVVVTRTAEANLSRVDRAWLEAAGELGIPRLADLNEHPEQFPVAGVTPKNVVDGRRLNAALSYLSMARGRPNFFLLPDTLVRRVLVEGRLVTGVETADGRQFLGREVILAGGAYGSPAILLRSGIGPAAHLHELGIPVVHDLPGVGEHLMDHPQLSVYTSDLTSFFLATAARSQSRRFIQTMIKARSRQVTEEIDLHLYPREMLHETTGRWVLGVGVSLQEARSRGTVRLAAPDPDVAPIIDHNYFADAADLEALADGVELLYRLVGTGSLARLVEGPVRADAEDSLSDREALKEVIRAEIGTTFHPSSSCRMGPADDRLAVVSADGRVHGLEGLRVVDASIFPVIPRCNLHCPTVVAAERIADLIRHPVPGLAATV